MEFEFQIIILFSFPVKCVVVNQYNINWSYLLFIFSDLTELPETITVVASHLPSKKYEPEMRARSCPYWLADCLDCDWRHNPRPWACLARGLPQPAQSHADTPIDDFVKGNSRKQVMESFMLFKNREQNTHHPEVANELVLATLLNPPKLCWFSDPNILGDIKELNAWICNYNEEITPGSTGSGWRMAGSLGQTAPSLEWSDILCLSGCSLRGKLRKCTWATQSALSWGLQLSGISRGKLRGLAFSDRMGPFPACVALKLNQSSLTGCLPTKYWLLGNLFWFLANYYWLLAKFWTQKFSLKYFIFEQLFKNFFNLIMQCRSISIHIQ